MGSSPTQIRLKSPDAALDRSSGEDWEETMLHSAIFTTWGCKLRKKQACHWVYHIYVLLSDLGTPRVACPGSRPVLPSFGNGHHCMVGLCLPVEPGTRHQYMIYIYTYIYMIYIMISQLHPIWAIHRVYAKDREDHKTC